MAEGAGDDVVDLGHYATAVWTCRWLVLALTAACAGVAFALAALQNPMYSASARVHVQPFPIAVVEPELNLETQQELIKSHRLLERAIEETEVEERPDEVLKDLEVEQVGGSSLVELTYSAPDPELARNFANVLAGIYIDYRIGRLQQDLETAERALNERIEALHAQIDDTSTRLRHLERRRNGAADAIRSQRESLLVRLGLLQQRAAEIQPEVATQVGGAELVEEARAPDTPSSPQKTRSLVLGALLGLVLGTGAAIARQVRRAVSPSAERRPQGSD